MALSVFLCQSSALCWAQEPVEGSGLPSVALEKPDSHGGFNLYAIPPHGRVIIGGTGVGTMTSPSGSETFGGEIVVWAPATGKLIRTYGTHATTPSFLGFPNDEGSFVSFSREDAVLKVWRTESPGLLRSVSLGAPGGMDDAPALSADGVSFVRMAARSLPHENNDDKDAHIPEVSFRLEAWDIAKGTQRWAIETDSANGELDVKFATTADSKSLAVAVKELEWTNANGQFRGNHSADEWIGMLSLADGKPLWRLEKSAAKEMWRGSIKEILLTPDGKEMLLVMRDAIERRSAVDGARLAPPINLKSKDSIARVWVVAQGKRIMIQRFMNKAVDIVAFPSGETLQSIEFAWPDTLRNVVPNADFTRIVGTLGFNPSVLDCSPPKD